MLSPRYLTFLVGLFCSAGFTQEARISEFLAGNASGLADEDGETSDWIEIENRSALSLNLEGWSLTDDPSLPRNQEKLWRFPAAELPPGSFLLVFASGKDRRAAGKELHSSFKLERDGGYVALLKPDGAAAHEYSPYPKQRDDISYGLAGSDPGGEERYFLSPTPGSANAGAGVRGFVADTRFSLDRGFYDAPFEVSISTTTEGAEIRYTTDGSAPSVAHGNLYQGPIRIATTTALRAAAFKADFAPTNVDAQTYIFPAGVVRQTGAGFPATWGGTRADYEMDPNVVDHPDYRDTIEKDIVERIPTLSIVMDNGDLFGPKGIYSNTQGRGVAWERPSSIELIYPDGRPGFQANCGLRIYGYGWRGHSESMKHAFRLRFKRKYGPAKLDYPFFPGWPALKFDNIVLRSQGSRSWNDFRVSIEQTCYIRDAWARYTAREMGKLTTSSTYVHLYLNGLYWGLYNPVERPDAKFMEEHLGGDESEYDALNARVGTIEVINGSRAGWDALMGLARGARVSTLDGFHDVQKSLEVTDLADYILIQFYTGNQDWPGSNGNNMRVAGAPGPRGGYRSFLWDMEYSIWFAADNILAVNTSFNSPAALHARLALNEEYRTLFGDRAHKHLANGGALTPERAAARWLARAEEIDRAVVGESARWGDRRREPPYTRNVEWVRERDRLINTYFPQRAGILAGQLKAAGLYPNLEAPSFSQHGGPIPEGFELEIRARAGRIFYTLDGADPRLEGGAISPLANEYDTIEPLQLIPEKAAVRVHVPADGSLGRQWIETGFDDSSWIEGETGVGFETQSGYESLIGTDVGGSMHGLNASVYLRLAFVLDNPKVSSLTLSMKYDDGYAAYLNGALVASRNAPAALEWNSQAAASHSDTQAVVFEEVDLSAHRDRLRAGANVLAIHGLNASPVNGDMLIAPKLEASEPSPHRLPIRWTAAVRSRAWAEGKWSALTEAVFIRSPLRITEIMYHPPDPEAPGVFAADDFEFIELKNTGGEAVDLQGTRLLGGINFDFSSGGVASLPPGGVVLIVKDLDAFASRYGTMDFTIAGEYAGRLSNAGDAVRLEGAHGETILEFSYDDAWYPQTDGGGESLVIADELAPVDSWARRQGWRPSGTAGGTPGKHGGKSFRLPGDASGDARLNIADAAGLLLHLFLARPLVLPCEGGTIAGEGNRKLLDFSGDGAVDLTDAIGMLRYLFLAGPPHVLGADCVGIEGCPEACFR